MDLTALWGDDHPGDLRTWPDGSSTVYRCRQDHTAYEGAGFNPSVASLWEIAP